MAQIKVYGERGHLREVRDRPSEIVHDVNRRVLGLPADTRFHRFIVLDAEDLLRPADRSAAYTIIEISMFEGCAPETKKSLLHGLMREVSRGPGISVRDIEITIFETPRANWGIRGKTGDELSLDYKVDT
jgi:phenylpyruvate tautomerase PptA (4-oxalocrotonate tautomerase family)